MTIDITTPALLFPAISLLLLAYTNRFLALARITRILIDKMPGADADRSKRQIANLRLRINLIKAMQATGIISILFCVFAMVAIFFFNDFLGRLCFGISLAFMTVSLILSLWEILLSGTALKIELEKLG